MTQCAKKRVPGLIADFGDIFLETFRKVYLHFLPVRFVIVILLVKGDYNMTPDRHLGSAWIDKCRPDLLISESTYATTIRDSKRCRERDFLKKVHDTIDKGGKVRRVVFEVRNLVLCVRG